MFIQSLAMPYTTKEQYEEVGKELIQLGYKRYNEPISTGNGYIVTNIGSRNKHFGSTTKSGLNDNQNKVLSDKDSYEFNKELFLALASLRDDNEFHRGDMVTDDEGLNIYKYDCKRGEDHYTQDWGFYKTSARPVSSDCSLGKNLRKATKEEIVKRVTEMFGNPCKAIPLSGAQPGGSVVGTVGPTKGNPGRKIIGYKAPFSLFGGRIQRGAIFSEYSDNRFVMYNREHTTSGVATEIVQTWEPVYEEPKIKIAGYEAEFLANERVKFGCQTFTKGEVNILATILFNKDISAKLMILGEEVTYDTLHKIYLKM